MRHKQAQALDEELSRRGLPADFEPKDGEGQGRIDGRLSFRRIDSENGECRLALPEQSAGIDWSEGFLEVDGGGQNGDGEARKMSLQGAAKLLLIADPGYLLGGRRTAVALPANFEFRRTRLAEALYE